MLNAAQHRHNRPRSTGYGVGTNYKGAPREAVGYQRVRPLGQQGDKTFTERKCMFTVKVPVVAVVFVEITPKQEQEKGQGRRRNSSM